MKMKLISKKWDFSFPTSTCLSRNPDPPFTTLGIPRYCPRAK
jgi:hypothetical protein